MTEERKQILKFNDKQLLIDLKAVSQVFTATEDTNEFFRTRKMDVRRAAKRSRIVYTLKSIHKNNDKKSMIIT